MNKIIGLISTLMFVSLFSCGPSKEEMALRERIVKDSLNRLLDSMRMANELSQSKKYKGNNINANTGVATNYLQKMNFNYRVDNSPLNPKTDVECRLSNRNSMSVCCFEFSIKCFDEYGHVLKSFSQSKSLTITPGSEEKFTLTYGKVKKCKQTKVELTSLKPLQ